MLEIAFEELQSRESGSLKQLRSIVAVTEGDLAIGDGFNAAVGDGDTKDIAAEIFEDLLARAGMLGMNHPGFLPHLGGDVPEQAGAMESGTQLGAKDHRQGADWNQEGRVFGRNPPGAIVGKTAGGDQHMDVRMIEQGPRPGVEHGQHAQTCSHITWITSQLLKGFGSRLHEQTVEFFGMSSGQGMQLAGQSEGQQVIVAGGETRALGGDPAFGLIVVTLRATAIATGVVGIDGPVAAVALMNVPSKERRSAVEDIG